ncbi:MAG: hypothetical protein GQ570_15120 [Helicobacteraceae bacterium]|nr:hypothetical protein [Helicobacteraceae bacterium]
MSQNRETYAVINERGINVKDFIETHYSGIEFKANKACCPFHADKSASFTYNKKVNYVHCFGCGIGLDAIGFVEKFENISNYEASKRVCELENISFDARDVEELSDEEKAEREETHQKRVNELEKRKAKEGKAEQKLRDKAKGKMLALSPNFLQNYKDHYAIVAPLLRELFPFQNEVFYKWSEYYIGYDLEQNSLVTINRVGDEIFNIKHRTKRDHNGNMYNGKWIGHYKGSVAPFPLEYFQQHESDAVLLLEGEKDCINAIAYDINNITLGGVSNSWENYKELLRDKIVYIWFDNDKAGYENSIKKAMELEGIASDVRIVLFYHIDPALPKGYDVSDFFKDQAFKNKSEIFHAIAYSTYKLTNELIDDIAEFCDLDFKKYHLIAPYQDFRDIKAVWSKTNKEGEAYNIFKIVGELDDKEVDDFLEDLKRSKGTKNANSYQDFRDVMIKSVLVGRDEKDDAMENMEKTFDRLMSIKKVLLTNYRQTHIVDALRAFLKMASTTGNTFAKYQNILYIWTGTHYQAIDKLEDLTTWIHNTWFYHAKFDIKKQTKRNIDEIVENITSKASNIDEVRRYEDRRVMNLLNGTLKISKRSKITFTKEHTKKDCATNILKFNYDENAKAPKWSKFLNRVLPDKADQQTLMEFIGYCFLPSHNYEAFLFLYGKSGANGKSVILDIIRSFFGEDNTSSLQLQQFFDHQLSSLQNKLINIGSEIDTKGMDKGQFSTLKALVSPKDAIQINPKNRDPYQLKPDEKPKLVFAGNDKPKGNDVDSAVFRRMLLLNFDAEIKDDEKIRDLSERFKDEMGGILNLSLRAMQTLVANGKFTKSKKMQGEIEAYKDEINPIRTFVTENIKLDVESMVPKILAYNFYKEWASEKGFKPFSEANFWKKVKDEIPTIDTTGKQVRYKTEYIGTDRPRCIEGISIISNEFTSFTFNSKSIATNLLNIDINTREIIIFEEGGTSETNS